MATTFTVNGREIRTKFGELALCGTCALQASEIKSCDSAVYPDWRDGWCGQHHLGLTQFSQARVKAIAAEAYQDGYEKCLEFAGESQREPMLDESRD